MPSVVLGILRGAPGLLSGCGGTNLQFGGGHFEFNDQIV